MKTSLPPLLGHYPTSAEEVHALSAVLDRLEVPAEPEWIAQRVVTLLTHYFVVEVHPAAMKSVAKDWIRELKGLPEWAVENACAWWLSRANSKRAKKPMPGDISERAHREIGIITVGRKQIEFFEQYGDTPPAFLRSIARPAKDRPDAG